MACSTVSAGHSTQWAVRECLEKIWIHILFTAHRLPSPSLLTSTLLPRWWSVWSHPVEIPERSLIPRGKALLTLIWCLTAIAGSAGTQGDSGDAVLVRSWHPAAPVSPSAQTPASDPRSSLLPGPCFLVLGRHISGSQASSLEADPHPTISWLPLSLGAPLAALKPLKPLEAWRDLETTVPCCQGPHLLALSLIRLWGSRNRKKGNLLTYSVWQKNGVEWSLEGNKAKRKTHASWRPLGKPTTPLMILFIPEIIPWQFVPYLTDCARITDHSWRQMQEAASEPLITQ